MGAVLCNEPFNLKPSDLPGMTPRQVVTYYLRDRDHDGRIHMQPRLGEQWGEKTATNDLLFSMWARFNCIPDWLRDQLYPRWLETGEY